VLDTRATPLPAEAPAASTDTDGPEQLGSARLGAFAFAAYLVVSFLSWGARIMGSFSTSFAARGRAIPGSTPRRADPRSDPDHFRSSLTGNEHEA
jgi:hypothetical protein